MEVNDIQTKHSDKINQKSFESFTACCGALPLPAFHLQNGMDEEKEDFMFTIPVSKNKVDEQNEKIFAFGWFNPHSPNPYFNGYTLYTPCAAPSHEEYMRSMERSIEEQQQIFVHNYQEELSDLEDEDCDEESNSFLHEQSSYSSQSLEPKPYPPTIDCIIIKEREKLCEINSD